MGGGGRASFSLEFILCTCTGGYLALKIAKLTQKWTTAPSALSASPQAKESVVATFVSTGVIHI